MTQLEFYRMMRGMVMPSEAHRAILEHVVVDNPSVENADMFGLCFGAVARVPMDKIHRVTLRQLQEVYGMPTEAYLCADPETKTAHREGLL